MPPHYASDQDVHELSLVFDRDLNGNSSFSVHDSGTHNSDVLFESTAFDFDMDFDENFSSVSEKALVIGSDHVPEPNLSLSTAFSGDLNYDIHLALFEEFQTPSCLPEFPRSNADNSLSDDCSLGNCFETDVRFCPSSSVAIRTCFDENYTCMVSATATLKSLHISASACLNSTSHETLSGTHRSRMTDAVLTTNKDAVSTVSNILKCSCSLRPQIQIVLASICDKLIAWYRVLIRSDHQNSSKAEEKRAEQDHVENVSYQPITIGSHSFHAAIESKIRAQVVLGDLKYLEALVETFLSRIEDVRGVRKVAEIWPGFLLPPDELARVIHERTSAYLRCRLQTAKLEIETLLS